ncbi:MAG: thioredoxin family protein [Burkholderiales bacterium]|nr:thioredoxin family protein [Burkholderiales bacterium]
MKIEVLHAPGCVRCSRELAGLRAAALALDPTVQWREINIVEAIDYAVALGVLKPPAVAIDGELVFSKLPLPDALATAMRDRRRAPA